MLEDTEREGIFPGYHDGVPSAIKRITQLETENAELRKENTRLNRKILRLCKFIAKLKYSTV